MKKIRLVIVLTVSIVLLSNCRKTSTPYYTSIWQLDDAQWKYQQFLKAEFEVTKETSDTLHMYVQFVLSDDYGYQNLYTDQKIIFPDTKQYTEQTSQELLTEEGYFAGKKKGRKWITPEYPIMHRVRFSNPGTYYFSISPYMREDKVQGVEEVRFIVRE